MQFLFVILGREFEKSQSMIGLVCSRFKCRMQCFSMQELQVVMNKYFFLNPEKNWRRSVLSFSRKKKRLDTL